MYAKIGLAFGGLLGLRREQKLYVEVSRSKIAFGEGAMLKMRYQRASYQASVTQGCYISFCCSVFVLKEDELMFVAHLSCHGSMHGQHRRNRMDRPQGRGGGDNLFTPLFSPLSGGYDES